MVSLWVFDGRRLDAHEVVEFTVKPRCDKSYNQPPRNPVIGKDRDDVEEGTVVLLALMVNDPDDLESDLYYQWKFEPRLEYREDHKAIVRTDGLGLSLPLRVEVTLTVKDNCGAMAVGYTFVTIRPTAQGGGPALSSTLPPVSKEALPDPAASPAPQKDAALSNRPGRGEQVPGHVPKKE